MIDVTVILLALIVPYAYFRSLGGEGFNVKATLAPSNTPEGKKQRIIGWSLFGLMVAAIIFVSASDQQGHKETIIIAAFSGVLVTILLRMRRSKR